MYVCAKVPTLGRCLCRWAVIVLDSSVSDVNQARRLPHVTARNMYVSMDVHVENLEARNRGTVKFSYIPTSIHVHTK